MDERGSLRQRVLLVVIAAVAGLGYGWAAGSIALEPYYAAAVQAMAGDWHAFAFGAFDPAQTITVDKLPGALWLQALSVRVFGMHTWAIVLPQIVEGVLTVVVLYRAVRRLSSPAAGLVAAAVLSLACPAVVLLDRGNVSDTLMILLLVLAADAVSAAVAGGSAWWLAAAGVWVGLAFQAKMIQAWLVLPALAVPVLVAGAGTVWRRLAGVVGAGVATAVVSLAWITVVDLLPTAGRPWVDGSVADSEYEQVFGYNGFGRIGGANPLQTLAAQGLPVGASAAPGWLRLLVGDLARDAAWLLVPALVVAVVGIVVRRSAPRTDPVRAAVLLWGLWLLTFVAVFAGTAGINTYYAAVLAPPVAALLGIGGVAAWKRRASVAVRVGAVVTAVVTAAYALLLLRLGEPPAWLPVAEVVVGLGAVALAVAAWRRSTGALPVAALLSVALAVLLVPVVASVAAVVDERGVFDSPFQTARTTTVIDAVFREYPREAALVRPGLEKARDGAPYLAAAQSAAVASVLSGDSGEEVLPIGGFSGTGPVPTLEQLRADIARGAFHLAFPLGRTDDPRIAWIVQHCRNLPDAAPPLSAYYCTPADAG